MTGLSYTVRIEDRDLLMQLESLIGQMEDLEPFHRLVGEHMLTSVYERFETETAPDGSRWQSHAPATVRSRLKRNGNAPLTILRESGRLAGSFNYEATSQHAKIGTPVIYAAIHHFGGEAGRNHAVTIPPRPILGLSANDETAIIEIAEDWLAN